MRKFLALILSAVLVAGVAGCGQSPAVDNKEQTQSQQEIYLSRPEASSVYNVEAPASDEDLVLDVVSADNTDVSAGNTDVSAGGAGVSDEAQTQPVSDEASAAAQTAASAPQGGSESGTTSVLASPTAVGELRAVWISYLTLEPMAKGKTKAQFTQNLDEAFANAAAFGFNTVFVQVRPFGDALYKSSYFPWSNYLTGNEGEDPGYDPLAIMCKLADDHGLRIEAWLNPYRVRASGGKPMSFDNQAKKWIAKGNDGALEWNGGVYYNPGSADARQLIVNGVTEIVKNYDVDGIHFDDYFYPTTDLSFDKATYKASGSKLSQDDWRRENVNKLVKAVYSAVKAADSDCVFGISPQGNVKINYESQYADVSKWLSTPGYVDYICPQIYYGYENDTCPYEETVDKWDAMITADGIDLYVGIAAYKLGLEDTWAGEGKTEWIGTTDILAQMVKTARDASNYGGVAMYSYDSLFSSNTKQVKAECDSLQDIF